MSQKSWIWGAASICWSLAGVFLAAKYGQWIYVISSLGPGHHQRRGRGTRVPRRTQQLKAECCAASGSPGEPALPSRAGCRRSASRSGGTVGSRDVLSVAALISGNLAERTLLMPPSHVVKLARRAGINSKWPAALCTHASGQFEMGRSCDWPGWSDGSPRCCTDLSQLHPAGDDTHCARTLALPFDQHLNADALR